MFARLLEVFTETTDLIQWCKKIKSIITITLYGLYLATVADHNKQVHVIILPLRETT